eukprot:403346582
MITLLRNSFQRPLLSHSPVLLPRAISNQSIYSCPLAHFSNHTSGHKKKVKVNMYEEETDGENYIRDVSRKKFKIPEQFNLYPMKPLNPQSKIKVQYLGAEVDILNQYKDEKALKSLYYLCDELNYFTGQKRFRVNKAKQYLYCLDCEKQRQQMKTRHPGFRVQCLRNENNEPILFVFNRVHFKGHKTDHDFNFMNDAQSKERLQKLFLWKLEKKIEALEKEKQRKAKSKEMKKLAQEEKEKDKQ